MTRSGKPGASTPRMTGNRRGGLRGVGGHLMAPGIATVLPARAARPMPRSISAPTIAACWSRARPATASGSSTRSPASSAWARAISASGRISDAAIDARGRGARHLPRQDEEPRGHARAADRHRSLPDRGEWRRVPRPHRGGSRARTRDRRSRDRGGAGRHRMHAADGSRRRGRDPVRHRRRLLRTGAAWPFDAVPARTAAAGDQGLGLDAGGRRDAGRAPWRARCHARRSTRPW